MAVRHPISRDTAWPTLWLMTDERMGEGLWRALDGLPPGSGVMFRHFATAACPRAMLFARIARIARRRRLLLLEAGRTVRHGVFRHEPGTTKSGGRFVEPGLAVGAAHSVREAIAARRAGATLILVSPVYPTRTHPGARSLGPLRAAIIARAAGIPAIALGGMTHVRFKRMKRLGFAGWAAIDGLTPDRRA